MHYLEKLGKTQRHIQHPLVRVQTGQENIPLRAPPSQEAPGKREQEESVNFVAFLDAQKAFDTVYNKGVRGAHRYSFSSTSIL